MLFQFSDFNISAIKSKLVKQRQHIPVRQRILFPFTAVEIPVEY